MAWDGGRENILSRNADGVGDFALGRVLARSLQALHKIGVGLAEFGSGIDVRALRGVAKRGERPLRLCGRCEKAARSAGPAEFDALGGGAGGEVLRPGDRSGDTRATKFDQPASLPRSLSSRTATTTSFPMRPAAEAS